jgi:hypothetical protein
MGHVEYLVRHPDVPKLVAEGFDQPAACEFHALPLAPGRTALLVSYCHV